MLRHFIVLVLLAATVLGQQKPAGPPAEAAQVAAPTYEPSELQRLKLENAQQKIIIIALQIQPLEQKRQEQLVALAQLCEAVRKENHWPENVKCNPSTLKFALEAPPQPRNPVPPPPGAKKEEERKP